ncbi:MAG: ATP-binding protein, partial [Gemmatimonadota bacterium]|nr:ATP-binding protein [Gemmatimonadota bacterium]
MSTVRSDWARPDNAIARYVRDTSARTLEAYASQPSLVDENANQEEGTARGGYARRQIVELVQNAADQLQEADGGRIEIRLTDNGLYVADNGCPIDEPGVRALMFSHLSPKHDTSQIGRFGVGFKSVLSVTDSPGVFSRSGSFVFDRERAEQRIREVCPHAAAYPVLRVAEPVDPHIEAGSDRELKSLMDWATNIVRLQLRDGAHGILAKQIREFRAEFLLFVPHVAELTFGSSAEYTPDRVLMLSTSDGQKLLDDSGYLSRWMVFSCSHHLGPDAREDRPPSDTSDCVEITWAVPVNRKSPHQHFWAFFPTETSSLVSGIFNAPWKTNSDRNNLLSGPYNEELIGVAARLVAESLPDLRIDGDPAAHIDVLGGRISYRLNTHAR